MKKANTVGAVTFGIWLTGCQPVPFVAPANGELLDFSHQALLSYNLTFKSHSVIKAGAIAKTFVGGGPSIFDAEFSGSIEISSEPLGGNSIVHIRPVKLKMSTNAGSMESASKQLENEIRLPFLIIRKPTGEIVSCSFSPNAKSPTRQFARSLIGLFQFVRPNIGPDQALPKTWDTKEDDILGTRNVAYTLSNPATILKKSGQYIANADPTQHQSAVGVAKIVMQTGNIKDIEGKELNHSVLNSDNRSDSELSYHAKLVRQSTVTRKVASENHLLANNLGREAREPLWIKPTEEEIRRDLAKATLGGTSESIVLAPLNQLTESSGTNTLTTDQLLKLRALIMVHPEVCGHLAIQLEKTKPLDAKFRAITEALINAGTDASQTTLIDYLKHNLENKAVVSRIIPCLAGMPRPSSASVSDLFALSEGNLAPTVSRSANLALGAMAFHLRSKSPDRADEIVLRLTTKLDQAQSSEQKMVLISSLGNSGARQISSALSPFVQSQDPEFRSAAITALRFVPGADGERPILHSLSDDQESSVRNSAIFALGFRESNEGIFAALIVAFRVDKEESVRRAALEQLWSWRQKSPAILTVIQAIGSDDPSAEIQKRCSELIQGEKQQQS